MTESDALVIEPLGKRHGRAAFSCGLPEPDRYLAHRASQDVRRRIARVFVCTAGEADAVLGFYTLSALSIDLASLPGQLSRKLPRHPVPCALTGRMAVDRPVHGRGLGRVLLADAKRFYEKFGFVPLTDDPMRLFLPLGHAALRGPKGQARPARDRPRRRAAGASRSIPPPPAGR